MSHSLVPAEGLQFDTLEHFYVLALYLQEAWLSYDDTEEVDLLLIFQGDDWTVEDLWDHAQTALLDLHNGQHGPDSDEERRNLDHEHASLLELIDEATTFPRRALGPSAAPRGAPPAANSVCFICSEGGDLIKLTCSIHFSHPGCLVPYFESAYGDATVSFPPKCCGHSLSLILLIGHINIIEFVAFEDRVIEKKLSTRAMYCHACASFIRIFQIDDVNVWCWRCRLETCASCRKKAHVGPCDDNKDSGLAQLKQLAEEQGWQRCKTCGTTVEKSEGCNHMRCVCGSHFCYICGADWKPTRACTCPQFDAEVPDPDGFIMGVDGIPRLPLVNRPGLLHVPVPGYLDRLVAAMVNRPPVVGGPLEGNLDNLHGGLLAPIRPNRNRRGAIQHNRPVNNGRRNPPVQLDEDDEDDDAGEHFVARRRRGNEDGAAE